MRVFIYEHLTAVGAGLGSPSLAAEGRAMLSAVVDDFGRVEGVETLTAVGAGQRKEAFQALAAKADLALVIAPEFDDLLATRCRWVREAGVNLLGPSEEAINLTADKLALAGYLRERLLPTPPTEKGDAALFCQKRAASPFLCKPRYGAGSQAMFLVHNEAEFRAARRLAQCEMPRAELILQPFVRGQSVSVAFLVGPGAIVPLVPGTQELSRDRRFRYEGGRLPLPSNLADRAIRLGRRTVESVPGLAGYVGIDLVLGQTPDDDVIIEINPRLTTSYIGLRRLARTNLAKAMLDVHFGRPGPKIEWHAGPVEFRADGTVIGRGLARV